MSMVVAAAPNKTHDVVDGSTPDAQSRRENGVQKTPSQSSPRLQSCGCCHIVAGILERLEAKASLIDRSALDQVLASQREALNQCGSVLQCPSCILRPEYTLLLGVVAERLTTSCESIVAQYIAETSQQTRARSISGPRPQKSSKDNDRLYIGCYGIESVEEWQGLMRFLLALQLRTLGQLVGSMKKAASVGFSVTRLPNIGATERRVAGLILKLRKSHAWK